MVVPLKNSTLAIVPLAEAAVAVRARAVPTLPVLGAFRLTVGGVAVVRTFCTQISMPEMLASPPVVPMLIVPSVTLAVKGPRRSQWPAAPLL